MRPKRWISVKLSIKTYKGDFFFWVKSIIFKIKIPICVVVLLNVLVY